MPDTMELDLEALLDAEWTVAAEPEPFDPMTLLQRMDVSSIAAGNALDEYARYVAGEPLVRHHRAPMHGWSFLCPDPRCMVWQTEFASPGEARTAWFTHCGERRHEFTPSWPVDVPFDEPTQPICRPRHYADSILIELIRRGEAVDNAGRPLTYERCEPCYAATPAGEWAYQHSVVSGTTCPGQVPCSKCGAAPGQMCDRSTRELSPINFGRDKGFSGHWERFTAAADADFWLEASGDLRFPAPWRESPAPSSRRTRPSTLGMKWTVRVEESTDKNELWQQLVFKFNRGACMSWAVPTEVAHVVFRTERAAQKFADDVVAVCGVPADAVTVLDSVAQWQARGLYAGAVFADAERVLRRPLDDGRPRHHLVWALGVLTVKARHLRGNNPLVEDLVREHGMSGRSADGVWIENNSKGSTLKEYRSGRQETVRWSEIAKMIRGKLPPALVREINTALRERAKYPTYTHEADRADEWLHDLALQAWMLVRPADMTPFDVAEPIDVTSRND